MCDCNALLFVFVLYVVRPAMVSERVHGPGLECTHVFLLYEIKARFNNNGVFVIRESDYNVLSSFFGLLWGCYNGQIQYGCHTGKCDDVYT